MYIRVLKKEREITVTWSLTALTMWRMFGFLLIFVTGYYAEDQRGIKWCLKYTQCREVYVESGKFSFPLQMRTFHRDYRGHIKSGSARHGGTSMS